MSVQIIKSLISPSDTSSIITLLDPLVLPTPRDGVSATLGWPTPADASEVGITKNVQIDTNDGVVTRAFKLARETMESHFGSEMSLVNGFYHVMQSGSRHELHCDTCNLDGSPLDDSGEEEPNKWSAVLYLNDSNVNYTGGDIKFPKQGLSYSPQSGDFVFFPADVDHPHQVEEITSGSRKCIVFFFGDRGEGSTKTFSDR